MNEATTRRELINPKLKDSKWGRNETIGSEIVDEYQFTDGRIIGGGQRGKQKKADYVLAYKNQKLAIVEAKAEGREITDGLEQVKDYAEVLNIRFVETRKSVNKLRKKIKTCHKVRCFLHFLVDLSR